MNGYRKLDINKLRENVESRLDSDIAENNVGFAEIAVFQDGEPVLKLAKGGDNDTCPKDGAKPCLYRIASMTKPVTAVAFLQQYEKGALDLNALLSDYMPEYADMVVGHVDDGKTITVDGPAKHPIRLVNLLTHTSGIDNNWIYVIAKKDHPRKTLRDTVEYFSKIPLAYDPSTATGYSESAAFDVIARLVEIKSGEDYADYLKKHLFALLGMNDSGFTPTEEQKARFVPMHDKVDGKSAVQPMTEGCVFEDMPYSCSLAGAGLFASLDDYAAFAEMLRLGGKSKSGERVVGEDFVRRMATPHVSPDIMPGTDRWGLGVRVVCEEGSHLPVGTFGWSGAYGSHFFIDPVDNITAVYMRNSAYDSGGCGSVGVRFEHDVMNSF